MSSKPAPYHHGNLKKALVEAGLDVLTRTDTGSFSMREVARKVGVSATSVYRHFPDKESFIDALCAEGSELLARALREAMASANRHEGFDASGLAYVRFALANSKLFRLMCRSHATDEGFGGINDPSMQVLLSGVASLLPKEADPQERYVRAMHAWSVVHGVTTLVLEGRIPEDDELILAIIRTPVK